MIESRVSDDQPESDGLTEEQRDIAAFYSSQHESQSYSLEDRVDPEEAIAEFLRLIEQFRTEYPLESIAAITDLTSEDASLYQVRNAASHALVPIVNRLRYLETSTTISVERYSELKDMYTQISNAVGFINNNRMRH